MEKLRKDIYINILGATSSSLIFQNNRYYLLQFHKDYKQENMDIKENQKIQKLVK